MMRLSGTGLWKRLSETERLNRVTWEYSHPRWPSSADGFCALFISDIHYGELLSKAQWDRLIRELTLPGCDVILFGGDFGDTAGDSLECIEKLSPVLEGKRVIAVPGNHDLRGGGELERLSAAAEKAGWEMPVNRCVPLTGGAAAAGLDDFQEGNPDVEKVRRESAGSPFTLLMAHNPDVLAGIEDAFYQLALCGHTHGGQVTLGGRGLISSSRYRERYRSGWKRENGADILIGNGIGVSLLPVRLGAVPQAIRIVFRHGEHAARLLSDETVTDGRKKGVRGRKTE